jgi:hypothetical protein
MIIELGNIHAKWKLLVACREHLYATSKCICTTQVLHLFFLLPSTMTQLTVYDSSTMYTGVLYEIVIPLIILLILTYTTTPPSHPQVDFHIPNELIALPIHLLTILVLTDYLYK